MDPREALIALNLVGQVGPLRLRALLQRFGDPAAVLDASPGALAAVPGIGPATAALIAGWRRGVDLSGELRRIDQYGCRVVIEADAEYPRSLRQIADPPPVLYVRGRLNAEDHRALAVVGSRRSTHYGNDVARRLSFQAAHAGFSIVSGGARGIDTAAHLAALAARGRTIAVLGTGINRVFPPENGPLFDRIAENGAVLSPFPFNRPPDRQSFPIRNRVVAGMALATVVVEAGATSGALITADFATDYGRPVLAVPGRIDSPASAGCHDLLRKGARLCAGLEDILAEFEFLTLTPTARGQRPPAASPDTGPLPPLNGVEHDLVTTLSREPHTVDELVRSTGHAPAVVAVALVQLEMKRRVRQLGGGRYLASGR